MSVMHDVLRERVMRHLESLPEAQLYQVLDYIEFLSSKYNRGVRPPSGIQRFGEVLEDKMRQQGLAFGTIRGALGVVGTAGKVVSGITEAGKSVLKEVDRAVAPPSSAPPAGSAPQLPPAPGAAPAASSSQGLMDSAGRWLGGLTEAGRSVLKEVGAVLPQASSPSAPAEPGPAAPSRPSEDAGGGGTGA